MEDVAAGKLLVDGGLGHLLHADGAEVGEDCKLFAGGSGVDRVRIVEGAPSPEDLLDVEIDSEEVAEPPKEAAADFPQGDVGAGDQEDEDDSVHDDTSQCGEDLDVEIDFSTSSSHQFDDEYQSDQGDVYQGDNWEDVGIVER